MNPFKGFSATSAKVAHGRVVSCRSIAAFWEVTLRALITMSAENILENIVLTFKTEGQ